MTKSSKDKVSLPLSDVRVFYNEKRNSYEVIGKSELLPEGFLTSIKRGSPLEFRLQAAFKSLEDENFQLSEPSPDQEKVTRAFLHYGVSPDAVEVPGHNSSKSGMVFAVTAPEAGNGVTTAAALLSCAITQGTQKLKHYRVNKDSLSTVIVEMSGSTGLEEYFGLPGKSRANILDFVNAGISGIFDMETVLKDNLRYDEKSAVTILPNCGGEVPEGISVKDLYAVIINTLKEMFDLVILDLGFSERPNSIGEKEAVAYSLSDGIIAVMDLEKVSLPFWKEWGEYLVTPISDGGAGLSKNQLGLVVNKSFRGGRVENFHIQELISTWAGAALVAIPNDAKAVSAAGKAGQVSSLLHHPSIGEASVKMASRLVGKMGYDLSLWNPTESNSLMNPASHIQAEELPKDETHIPIGVDDTGREVLIDMCNSTKPNTLLAGAINMGTCQMLYNIRIYTQMYLKGKRVYVHGLPPKSPFLKGETALFDDMELLLLLRKISTGVVAEGEDCLIVLGNFDSLLQFNTEDTMQARVDKAVRAEILEMVRFLSSADSANSVHFLFLSERPDASLNSFLPSCQSQIYARPKFVIDKSTSFINANLGDLAGSVWRMNPNRAYVKVDNAVNLVQAFEPMLEG